jgi:hypothetical protein
MAALIRLQVTSLTMTGSTPKLSSPLSASTPGSTDTLSFSAALLDGTGVAIAVSAPNYLPLVIEPSTSNAEVVWVTALTASATSATILRAMEAMQILGTATAPAHAAQVNFLHAPTPFDFIAHDALASFDLWRNFA